MVEGKVKGYKKILVLYINYGKQKKPEKTNWVMHQYHLGNNEDEKEGELVVSKVFYQTQPRQCGTLLKISAPAKADMVDEPPCLTLSSNFVEYYDSSTVSFKHEQQRSPVMVNFPCP